MKKSITTISLLIISFVFLAPQVAMAVWWNPFTWFKKKSVPVPVEQVSVKTTEKEATQQPVPQVKEKKEVVVNSKPAANKTVEIPINPKKEVEKEKVSVPAPIITPIVLTEPKVAPITLSISSVNIDPKVNSVYVSWQTNTVSESKFLLNGIAYQSKNGVDSLHYVEIKDLNDGQSYKGTITALANNAWANKEISFTTKEAPYTTPPTPPTIQNTTPQPKPDTIKPIMDVRKTVRIALQKYSTDNIFRGVVKLQPFYTDMHPSSGIEKAELYFENTLIGTVPGDSFAEITWDTTQIPKGTYTITGKVYDKAGNIGTEGELIRIENN